MCCLGALGGTLAPRIALIVWWIVRAPFFDKVFSTAFWPVIGIIFAPWTTLFFTISWRYGSPEGHLAAWGYVLIVIGILFDLASHGGGLWRSRRRLTRYAR
jgi:hypothetical protein